MAKTILIASIIAGLAIMLLLSSQQVYAPPGGPAERVTFSFNQASIGSSFTMQGGGMWIVGDVSSVNAAGGSTKGNWQATTLTMVGCCSPVTGSSSTSTVFFAAFGDGDTLKVAVAANDVDMDGDTGNGVQNFWVDTVGFGTANARFH